MTNNRHSLSLPLPRCYLDWRQTGSLLVRSKSSMMFRDIQTITCVCEGTRDTCSGSVVVLFLTPRIYRRGNQAVRQVYSSQLSWACLFGRVITNHLSCKLAFNPDFIVWRAHTFSSLHWFLPSLSEGFGASSLLNKMNCMHLSSRQMLSYWYYSNQFISPNKIIFNYVFDI